LGEDGASVSVSAVVGELDRLLQGVHADGDEHGAEDLLEIGHVLRVDIVQDSGAHEVAGLVHGVADEVDMLSAVQQELRALGHALGDEVVDALLGGLGDDGSDVHAGLPAGTHLQLLRARDDVSDHVLALADENHHGQCHAALTRGSEGSGQDRVHGVLVGGVGQHSAVVLRACESGSVIVIVQIMEM
jgi:hypothetical protein